jgi:PAS domain S-box-containing protein
VLVLDYEGLVRRINRTGQAVTGFAPAELEGRPLWATLLPPEDAEAAQALAQGIGSLTSAREIDGWLQTKDNRRLPVHWTIRPAVDAKGAVHCLVVHGRPRGAPTACGAFDAAASDPFEPLPYTGKEARRSSRVGFQYRQRIASMTGEGIPSEDEYFEVKCKDISCGGISFYLDDRPDFKLLMVGLGCPPRLAYISAKVVRVAEETVGGRTRWLVGCRFLGRIEL